MGEKIENTVDHPVLRPSLNCIIETYDMALMPEYEDLMTAHSHLIDEKVNRFSHIDMDKEDLMVLQISKGEKAEDKAKLIAEEISNFLITSDRKLAYVVNEDDELCAVNGKKGGKAKMISNDDVSSGITISNKDVVYYTSDGDVYAAKGRSKGKKVLEDASFNRFGGYVYISDDDVLYAARGTSKPKKLLDRE
jgi:hypothetical protein